MPAVQKDFLLQFFLGSPIFSVIFPRLMEERWPKAKRVRRLL